jgi:Putative phage tail protein
MFKFIFAFLSLLTVSTAVYPAGTIIATAVLGMTVGALSTAVVAFAINMVVSAIISKAFFTPNQPSGADGSGSSPDVGNRQQVPPATDNKLPVVYGEAWVGGTIVDLSITENNQELYYVLAISEVTNTPSSAPDTITFGDIYWGGKKVTFRSDGFTVASLTDESSGVVDTTVDGRIAIYLYSNGSNTPFNSSQSAISVMQASDLTYKWDSTKLMTNTAFAIVKLTYSQTANIRGIEQTRFQVFNSRSQTGEVFYDYLTNTRYGGAIPTSQIDNNSLNDLSIYSNQSFSYTDSNGNPATQPRFVFNGVIDTNRSIMDNLQDMASCCDCLIKYNEITAQWGVIVQQPTYTVAMDINDSNMVSAISISPIDLAGSYNIIECKFPDNSVQDTFNTATFDLAEIAPSLLFANEPVNKMSISLPLVNNDVQAQYIANRLLKSAREDLQVQASINYVGIQLEAGDIVTLTNANYGWTAKPFRVNKIIEQFADDGAVIAKLTLSEFNSTVYDDVSITQFQTAPNTGISDPTFFGTVPAPTITSQQPNSANPSFNVSVTTAISGITQYAEVWYSAFSNPTADQRIFAGTTAIQSSGNPYSINTVMPDVTLNNIPAGNWYFFSRMVNSLASSSFSPASSLFVWKPTTVQYGQRWIVVAYADNATGTSGFTTNPRNKAYYGLANATTSSPISDPAQYTWYEANPSFSTDKYLLFSNRTGRRFSFATGTATYVANNSFVPSDTAIYDQSVWSALVDGTNYIDLDKRTGQLTETGTTSTGLNSGEISVTNDASGRLKASLAPVPALQALSGGAGTFTATVAKLTIDIYGRVLGFEPPDDFEYTTQQFNATSGQTVFTVTRGSDYLINNCFVFQNGCLLDESEYTDTGGSTGTVTLSVGADLGDIVTIISMKSVNLVTGSYNSFSRETVDLTSVSEYTASGFTLVSGYELLFLNGMVVNDQDYDIVGQTIQNFPDLVTGKLTIIQWSNSNLNIPNGTPINVSINTVIGEDTYPFSYVADALNIYQNGVLLDADTDYTAGFGEYTLSEVPFDSNQILLQQTFNRTGAV